MLYVSADTIYPINQSPIKNGIIVLNENNIILDILKDGSVIEKGKIKHYDGSICPGFVNTHCHTELSHLHSQIPQHTGLVEFVQQIVKYRNQFSKTKILNSIESTNNIMLNNGIVAVGDICNTDDSIEVKKNSKLYYHNFIELIGFNPSSANDIFDKGKILLDKFLENNLIASFSAHAPYSVSDKLMQLIALHEKDKISCMHNQESEAENDFFITASGDLLKLYKNFGIDITQHKPTGKTSFSSVLKYFNGVGKMGLIHNTFMNEEDFLLADSSLTQFFFCICINANLFIENRMPNLNLIKSKNQKICIGTDSLASNNELSILSELKTIQTQFKKFELNELLKWATLNGAEFLGIENKFGSLQIGKKPGLVVFDEKEMKVKKVLV
jgi:cytosine/adenosine deaminase-related metal-dependent hydrolase